MAESTSFFENEIANANSEEELDDILSKLPREDAFKKRLNNLFNEKNIKPADVLKKICLSKSMLYKCLDYSSKGVPGKETIIKIALGMKLSIGELNELLKLAGHKELYAKNKEDAIIIYGLKNDLDMYEIDDMLRERNSAIRLYEEDDE